MPKYRTKRHSVTQPSDLSYRLIPLTQGQNAIVDAADYEWLNQWPWYADWGGRKKNFYVQRFQGRKVIRMHRFILGCKKRSEHGDHINGNTLDNRRANLRKCTVTQNNRNMRLPQHNTSGFKGVSWEKRRGQWETYITIKNKKKHLGYFSSREDGARAYDKAAKKHFGKFALLNFPSIRQPRNRDSRKPRVGGA
jgi:hypothetical protein